ncbi:hypothetical protein ACVBEG_27715 [Pseudomonas sp. GG8]
MIDNSVPLVTVGESTDRELTIVQLPATGWNVSVNRGGIRVWTHQ